LWDYVFNTQSLQRDLFNVLSAHHPLKEYPGFDATVSGAAAQAHALVKDMMRAITDQGEGSLIKQEVKKRAPELLQQTLARYAPSRPALEADYSSYDSSGNKKNESDDAGARWQPGRLPGTELDHYERFQEIRDQLLKDVVTWDKWRPGQQNKWTAKDLGPGVDNASKKIPSPDAIAQALNRLAADPSKYYEMFSQVCVGSIKGITTVLDKYWSDSNVKFPNPSMYGSGDRVAICWALFGKAPDLSLGIKPPGPGLQHSCQGLDFNAPGGNCAEVNVFHTCKGSNACKAEGGCGFVNSGGCGFVAERGATAAITEKQQPLTGPNVIVSAPGDNGCGALGGCAVPISASQLYPSKGLMQLMNFPASGPPQPVGDKLPFEIGDSVYDIAWQAYAAVMKIRGQNPGTKPAPNDLRMAFPPST
jgi:hypothetical protein